MMSRLSKNIHFPSSQQANIMMTSRLSKNVPFASSKQANIMMTSGRHHDDVRQTS